MSEKKISVLFVGNSYTYYNKMPETYFVEAANASGYTVEVTSVTHGGYRLSQFADPENEEGKRLRETIAGRHYDVAVLQEQSVTPITDEAQFQQGVGDVKALIDADRFILYATWGRNDESPNLAELGMTRAEMTERLNLAYHRAAERCGAQVAEVGMAFLAYAAEHDKDDLYKPDHSHPSEVGSALAAKVLWDAIIR